MDRRTAPIAWRPLAQHLAKRFAPAAGDAGSDDDATEALTRVAMAAMAAAAPDPQALGQDLTAAVIPPAIRALRRHRREQIRRNALSGRTGPDLQPALVAAEEELGGRGNRSPTVAEVAAHLGVAEDHVVAALAASWSYPDRPGTAAYGSAAACGPSAATCGAGTALHDAETGATRAGSSDRSAPGTLSSGRSCTSD